MTDHLPSLPESASLSQWQTYVAQTVAARGWDKASDLEVFLLFSEEVGEFAKALRRFRRLFHERPSSEQPVSRDATEVTPARQELAEELADVLSYLLDLANRLEIDLEQAFIAKERGNRDRDWELPVSES